MFTCRELSTWAMYSKVTGVSFGAMVTTVTSTGRCSSPDRVESCFSQPEAARATANEIEAKNNRRPKSRRRRDKT
jgi:hypothetical protein